MSPSRLPRPTRYHLLGCASSLVLSACLLGAAFSASEQARSEYEEVSRQTRQRERQQQQGADEIAEKARYQPIYQQILGMAPTGTPESWASTLFALQKECHLPALRYELLAPTTHATAGEGGLALIRQTLNLQLALRHEEELLRLLETLVQHTTAQPVIRRCRLARKQPAGLTADCSIDWLTLRPASP